MPTSGENAAGLKGTSRANAEAPAQCDALNLGSFKLSFVMSGVVCGVQLLQLLGPQRYNRHLYPVYESRAALSTPFWKNLEIEAGLVCSSWS